MQNDPCHSRLRRDSVFCGSADPCSRVRSRRLRRHVRRRRRGGAGQAPGQERGHCRSGPPSWGPHERRAWLHRHRQQGRHRRPLARGLSPRLAALRTAGCVDLAETRGVRQQGTGDAGHRWRRADHVDLRAARRRARVRGSGQGTSNPRRSRRVARSRARRGESRRPNHLDHDAQREAVQRADVHRCHVRRRPDGRRRRRLPYRARVPIGLRREVERRPDRRPAPSASFRRAEAADQPVRRAGRSAERRAAADKPGESWRVRSGR